MRKMMLVLVATLLSIGLIACNAELQRPEFEPQKDTTIDTGPVVIANIVSPVDEKYFPLTLPSYSDYRYRLEHLVFDGILKINKGHTFSDNLGSIQFSDNYKKATISIQERNWHDGTKVTANDVVFTYSLLLDRDSFGQFHNGLLHIAGGTEYFSKVSESISGITVIDDNKLEFNFTNAVADNLMIFTYPILPKHIYQNLSNDQLKEKFQQTLIGSSPYQVMEIRQNEIHVKYSEEATNAITGNRQGSSKHIYEEILKNTPGGIIFRTYSPEDLHKAMEWEEFDIIYTNEQAVTKLQTNNPEYQVKLRQGNMFFYLGFNLKTGQVNEGTRRQIQQILENTTSRQFINKYWEPINSFHRESSVWYHRPTATQVSTESININGGRFSLLFLDKPESAKVASQIKEILSTYQIDIDLRAVDYEEYLNQMYVTRNFDMFIGTAMFSVLPVQDYWWSKKQLVENNGFNQTGFTSQYEQELQQRNVEFISLAYQKNDVELNRTDSISEQPSYQLYQQLQGEMYRAVPFVFLASPNDMWLIHERIVENFDEKFH